MRLRVFFHNEHLLLSLDDQLSSRPDLLESSQGNRPQTGCAQLLVVAARTMRAGTRSRASEIWPSDVLLRLWPPDKVLMGMQVCGYLRCELAKVPVVVVEVDEPKRSGCPRTSKASRLWSAENLARGLMRLSGHVQLQIPATMPGAYV